MPRIMLVNGSPCTNVGNRLMSVTPSAFCTRGMMALPTEGTRNRASTQRVSHTRLWRWRARRRRGKRASAEPPLRIARTATLVEPVAIRREGSNPAGETIRRAVPATPVGPSIARIPTARVDSKPASRSLLGSLSAGQRYGQVMR